MPCSSAPTRFDQNLGPWYIVLDDNAIESGDVPGAVGNISTRNPYLDGQNPEYGIGSGGDSNYFEINGNVLSMLSVPDGDAGPYTVDITSTGDYGTDNSRTYEITVISSDITSPNSTVEPEPDTAVDTQVEPEPDTAVDTQVEQDPDTAVDTQVEPKSDTVVDTQVEPKSDTVVDTQVEPKVRHCRRHAGRAKVRHCRRHAVGSGSSCTRTAGAPAIS